MATECCTFFACVYTRLCVCVRKPEGSEAVFAYGPFPLDLCLSVICLHLILQGVSVGDTAAKLHGERQRAGMCSSSACNCLFYSFIYFNVKDCSAPQSLSVHFVQQQPTAAPATFG